MKAPKLADDQKPADKILTPDERRDKCAEEVAAILRHYGCQITATIHPPEAVGPLGNKIQLTATCGVVAMIEKES